MDQYAEPITGADAKGRAAQFSRWGLFILK